MKKIIFICISIFAFFSINVHASTESISDGIEWSIRWQGYTCTGVYNGEIKNNKPDGNGEFEGQIFIEETPGDIIVYDGKWINGMFDGKGVLENKTSHVKYVGDFSEGKLNGEIEQYNYTEDNELQSYSSLMYLEDIPYGVQKVYNSENELIDFDYYVHGMGVSQIRENAESISYRDLLYFADENINRTIGIQGYIAEIDDLGANEEYQYIKFKDLDENFYILKYSADFPVLATKYIPFFKVDDEVEIYGYCAGISKMPGESIEYPCIELVYADWHGDGAFDYNTAAMSYEDFRNYPYFYLNEEIQLCGTYKGLNKITKKWMYFLVESDSYSKGLSRIYVCRVKNSDKNRNLLPLPETSIVMTGDLHLLSKQIVGDKIVYCPLIQSTKIFK